MAEPASKLLVYYPLDVFLGLACAQSRENRPDLGLIFIGVAFEVDADGISTKEDPRYKLEELAVRFSQFSAFCPEFLKFVIFHTAQSVARDHLIVGATPS